MSSHLVVAEREGPWWVLRIPRLDTGGQAATLDDVEHEARGIIRAWTSDNDAGDVDVRVIALVVVDVTPWGGGFEVALDGETITQAAALDDVGRQVRDYLDTIDPRSDHSTVDVHLRLTTPSTIDGGRTWQARAQFEDGWWIITVPELDHVTQAHTVDDVDMMARDLIAATTDTDARSFTMDVAITAPRAHTT